MHSSNQYQFSVFSLNRSLLDECSSLCRPALIYVGFLLRFFFSISSTWYHGSVSVLLVFLFLPALLPFSIPLPTPSLEVTIVNHCGHVFFHVWVMLCSVYTKVLGFCWGAEEERVIYFMHPFFSSLLYFLAFSSFFF